MQESREGGSQHGEEDKISEAESWMKRTFPRYFSVSLVASGFYVRCRYVLLNNPGAERSCVCDRMPIEIQPALYSRVEFTVPMSLSLD